MPNISPMPIDQREYARRYAVMRRGLYTEITRIQAPLCICCWVLSDWVRLLMDVCLSNISFLLFVRYLVSRDHPAESIPSNSLGLMLKWGCAHSCYIKSKRTLLFYVHSSIKYLNASQSYIFSYAMSRAMQ